MYSLLIFNSSFFIHTNLHIPKFLYMYNYNYIIQKLKGQNKTILFLLSLSVFL